MSLAFVLFCGVLAVPIVLLAGCIGSAWMRRGTIALTLPVVLGAVAWCYGVLPMAQEAASCDAEQAMASLYSGGGLITTLGLITTGASLWLLAKKQLKWSVLLPAGVLILASECMVVLITQSVAFRWAFSCHF